MSSSKTNKSGRNSPNTQDEQNQYKAFNRTDRKSPIPKKHTTPNRPNSPNKNNKSGRNSPPKFVFKLQQPIKNTQSTHKVKHILEPVLTKAILENEYEFIPINSPMNSPTQMLELIEEEYQKEPDNTIYNDCNSNYEYYCNMKENTNTNTNTNMYKYYAHINIINILKYLVFNNIAIICGTFNSSQIIIDEYTKIFMKEINSYEISNNIKFTNEQINNLFVNENIYSETMNRLNLQSTMDIVISKVNFITFLKSFKYYFKNDVQYNIKYINKGNIKNNIDKDNDLHIYNTNGSIINLYVINISNQQYNINFETNFIVLENDNSVPLKIPIGLYNAEHLYIAYNGNNYVSIQYSNSSIDYIINNINMKIISLMPKVNDYDYTKIAKYILEIMNTSTNSINEYMFEFDIYNTLYKKSDFWITNNTNNINKLKIKDTNSKDTNSKDTNSKDTENNKICSKCDIHIINNSKYVISKCCINAYHIECMEMNYYQHNGYNYLVCDCGCSSMDINSCNSRLLCALYTHYY
jgi:hypothetical protein